MKIDSNKLIFIQLTWMAIIFIVYLFFFYGNPDTAFGDAYTKTTTITENFIFVGLLLAPMLIYFIFKPQELGFTLEDEM